MRYRIVFPTHDIVVTGPEQVTSEPQTLSVRTHETAPEETPDGLDIVEETFPTSRLGAAGVLPLPGQPGFANATAESFPLRFEPDVTCTVFHPVQSNATLPVPKYPAARLFLWLRLLAVVTLGVGLAVVYFAGNWFEFAEWTANIGVTTTTTTAPLKSPPP